MWLMELYLVAALKAFALRSLDKQHFGYKVDILELREYLKPPCIAVHDKTFANNEHLTHTIHID